MSNMSILIVEDDGVLAAHTEDLIARMGYRPLGPVATGEDAIRAVQHHHPDLVLMDIELPGGMNGVDAALRIQQFSDVPFVYLTGYSQDALLKSAKLTSPYGYLVKPVSERELAVTIEMALYRHDLDRQVLESREESRRSEARFRTLFESMSEGVALHEVVRDAAGNVVDYRILTVNPAYEKQTGIAAAECAGQLASQVYGTEKAPFLDEYAKVASTGEPLAFETWFEPLQKHFFISAACPTPGTFSTVFRDITERRNMEKALEREREKYRVLFDHAGDAIFVRGENGQFVDVNQVACKRLGYAREELLNLPPGALYSAEDAPGILQRKEQVLREGALVSEVTHVTRDGRTIPTELNSRLVRFDGNPAILSVARDISERKQAESALREHEAFLQDVIDSLPAHVAVLDQDGVIVSVNRAWAQFGAENGALQPGGFGVGLNYLSVCERAAVPDPEGTAATALGGIRAVLDGRVPYFSMEYPCHSLTERRWFVINVTPLSGAAHGAVVVHSPITTRMLAEESLRERTEELDRYFNTSLDLFCIARIDGSFERVNSQWSATLGYPLDELNGARLLDYVVPDDLPATMQAIARLQDQEEVLDFTNRYRCRDGSVRWLEWHAIPQGGRIFAAARDVTGRRTVEEALARSQAELQTIYESAPVILCLLDEKRQVLYSNRAFQEVAGRPGIHGARPGDLLGCVNALDDPRGCGFGADCGCCKLRAALDETLLNRHPLSNIECKITLYAEGNRREVVMLAATGWIEAVGEPRILLCLSDITERKRAEERIRQSEENYRSLIEQLPEGIIVHAMGRILFANEGAAKMIGYGCREDLVGVSIERFVHPDSLPQVLKRVRALQVGAPTAPLSDLKYVRLNGTAMDVEATSVAVVYQGKPAIHTIFRDISQRKRLEQQLLQAQKMETVGRLAGGVAHDFNNLLTIINGYSRMLLSSLDPGDPMWDTVDEIWQAGERAVSLTRQLLAFSRKQIMQPRLLDLNTIVGGMRSMLQRLLGEDVKLRFQLDACPPIVHADPHQLEQVIMNLVVNARDAMPSGGTVSLVTLADGPSRGGREYAQLSIRDTGCGMDAKTRQRIFEPFFTTKGAATGTGLGLSVVQGIVEQSGGFIDVASEPGAGSVFHVSLPRIAGAMPDIPKPIAEIDLNGRETILLVEDQEQVRQYAIAALSGYGYKVLGAHGAQEALDLWSAEGAAIDLVIADVVMPEVSGPELANRLRELRPDVQVLFISGYADRELSHHGLSMEETHLLQKPFTPEQLTTKVREMLARRAPRRRIMVVDDEIPVRKFMRRTLERAGFEVIEASDGTDALRQVRRDGVNLVITDLIMPGQEGIGTIRLLRKEIPCLGIIAMSGAVEQSYLATAKMLGADAVLPKPISTKDLLETVGRVLAMRA